MRNSCTRIHYAHVRDFARGRITEPPSKTKRTDIAAGGDGDCPHERGGDVGGQQHEIAALLNLRHEAVVDMIRAQSVGGCELRASGTRLCKAVWLYGVCLYDIPPEATTPRIVPGGTNTQAFIPFEAERGARGGQAEEQTKRGGGGV